MTEKDYTNTVCTRLYLPAFAVEEKCRLGYPNDNRCVVGHPYCAGYRQIPEMRKYDKEEPAEEK